MRSRVASSISSVLGGLLVTLGGCNHHDGGQDVDAGPPPDACEGLGCPIVHCGAQSLPPTRVSGTVDAPNGTLPLYGVTVYVPIHEVGHGVPRGASTMPLTPQEEALAFLFFEISSCVGALL